MSEHQLFMLRHLALGWKFRLDSKVRGSWNTYWSLRRRGLVDAGSVVTEVGRRVLAIELRRRAEREARR